MANKSLDNQQMITIVFAIVVITGVIISIPIIKGFVDAGKGVGKILGIPNKILNSGGQINQSVKDGWFNKALKWVKGNKYSSINPAHVMQYKDFQEAMKVGLITKSQFDRLINEWK